MLFRTQNNLLFDELSSMHVYNYEFVHKWSK